MPEKLPKAEREPLFEACDRALGRTVELFEPRFVVGIGKFAEKKVAAVVGELDVTVGSILHPSPASPAANRGWAEQVNQSLAALGHLHAHGMVHRDVSPDNLMLSRDIDGAPRVKLIDLGIAKSMKKSEIGLTATGIASVALANDLPLFTRNPADFAGLEAHLDIVAVGD